MHPFFFGVQYHPEFVSHPLRPSPPFLAFVLAASGQLDKPGALPLPALRRARYRVAGGGFSASAASVVSTPTAGGSKAAAGSGSGSAQRSVAPNSPLREAALGPGGAANHAQFALPRRDGSGGAAPSTVAGAVMGPIDSSPARPIALMPSAMAPRTLVHPGVAVMAPSVSSGAGAASASPAAAPTTA